MCLKFGLRIQNLCQTCVRSENETEYTEQHDANVLPEHPVMASQLIRPERDNLDERWKNQRQRRAADGSDQRNDGSQIGNDCGHYD